MKVKFFVLFLFCSCAFSCAASRQNNASANTLNTSNTEKRPNDQQAQSREGQAAAGNTPDAEIVKSENRNSKDNFDADSSETSSNGKIENRCGWYSNPTPGNHWLEDKDGEWIIGTQGGQQADGDYPPEFSDDQWVKTNINYGYGCACLRVETDRKNRRITKVVSATAKPLSACRSDKALKEPTE